MLMLWGLGPDIVTLLNYSTETVSMTSPLRI